MIKIEVPEPSGLVRKGECKSIPKDKAGVYLFYGESGRLLYVGQTIDLKTRIYAHFTGCTNTSRVHKEFEYCAYFFEDKLTSREIYEYYMINELLPEYNKGKNRNSITPNEEIRVRSNPIRCKGIRVNGEKCKSYANTNGYCQLHGGNGITFSSVKQKAIAKVLEQEIF